MIFIVPHIAENLQLYPDFISPYQRDHLNKTYHLWAYSGLLFGTMISALYFLVKKGRETRELRTWALLAPLYITFICAMGVILYFRFIR
jgi:hypothetical protein